MTNHQITTLQEDIEHSFVYIFSLGFGNFYKIGRSKNWRDRLETFKISNPLMKEVIVLSFPDASRIERYMHFINTTDRVNGEIFRFSQINLTNAINHLNFFAEFDLTLDWRKRYARLQMDEFQISRT